VVGPKFGRGFAFAKSIAPLKALFKDKRCGVESIGAAALSDERQHQGRAKEAA